MSALENLQPNKGVSRILSGAAVSVGIGHDFQEVETLPENDRVRYTISPAARKEVLRCLLGLNHERAAAESCETAAKNEKSWSKPPEGDAKRDLLA